MPNLVSAVRVGLVTLRSNPLRTSLSTIGVVIGVASLVAVLAVGDGLERFVRAQIERTTDLQTIAIRPRTQDQVDGIVVARTDVLELTPALADSLQAALVTPADVFLSQTGAAHVSGGHITGNSAALLFGFAARAAERRASDLSSGRFYTADEAASGAQVAMITESLARALSGGSAEAALDQRIRFGDAEFVVVGVVKDDPDDPRRAALIPYSTIGVAAPATLGRPPLLEVRVHDAAMTAAARAEVDTLMTRWAGPAGVRYAVESYGPARLKQVRQGILLFKVTMGTFAGIALLVGGIGIMNVLLSAVIERTREIGIRKACGARDRDVMAQFLSESVAITGVGAVFGAAVGLAGAFAATAIMRRVTDATIYAAFTWKSLMAAALVAVVIGLVFGTYPALRAARLSPVDAMRNE